MWPVCAFVVFVWNAFALGVGVTGFFQPARRPALARIANGQASAALGISVVSFVLGLVFGAGYTPFGGSALVVAWAAWALGGIFPFTIALFLRARRRRAEPDESDPEAG